MIGIEYALAGALCALMGYLVGELCAWIRSRAR